jgi:hypothetical protein
MKAQRGVASAVLPRPLIEHPRPLPNGYSGARAYPDVVGEDGACLVEVIARVDHAQDTLIVLGPKLDLVEIAVVRIQRVVGLLVGPVAHRARRVVI